jgi:hypothetical protein
MGGGGKVKEKGKQKDDNKRGEGNKVPKNKENKDKETREIRKKKQWHAGQKLSPRSLHHGSEKFVLGDRIFSNKDGLAEVKQFKIFRSFITTRNPYNLLDNTILFFSFTD